MSVTTTMITPTSPPGQHWNNSGQQFEAGKLGMWLFLATEFLLFAGLFCVRGLPLQSPELFEYGAKFLDWKVWGPPTPPC